MKLFIFLAALYSLMASAGTPPTCEGSDLTVDGTIIYQFSFRSNCLEALQEAMENEGRFCDDNCLIDHDGRRVAFLTFKSDCQRALQDLKTSRYKLFCADYQLHQLDLGFIAGFSFESECQEAWGEANAYSGHFCQDEVLMDHRGTVLADYRFHSSCMSALTQNYSRKMK